MKQHDKFEEILLMFIYSFFCSIFPAQKKKCKKKMQNNLSCTQEFLVGLKLTEDSVIISNFFFLRFTPVPIQFSKIKEKQD